jgi:5-methylcytosine-specific restriction endonuclease McrA
MKTMTVPRQKKLTWKTFSEYIRKRDADWKGDCTCVTCGTVKPIKEMQAGHFIQGRHNSILFDERNVHAQCYSCNVMKYGNSLKYYRFMESKYGDEVIKELEEKDAEPKSFTVDELKELREEFKRKIEAL